MSLTMLVVGYSLPMIGVTSSNLNEASKMPFFFRGSLLPLLTAWPLVEVSDSAGSVALGAIPGSVCNFVI